MQVFMMRGWRWRWLHESQPISDRANGVGVSTLRGAISTRRITVSTPGLFEVVVVWQHSGSGGSTLSSPVGAGSTSPSQSAISQREMISGFNMVAYSRD